jgi:hypothetical protein
MNDFSFLITWTLVTSLLLALFLQGLVSMDEE